MNIDEKIKKLDDFINNVLETNFHKKDREEIKPFLIDYIKTDRNVTTFSALVSEKIEFVIDEFIKKSCIRYCTEVKNYTKSYFNEQNYNPSSNKLLDKLLDRFCDSMEFYIDEFLEETFPEQDVLFLRDMLNSILANREATKLSLREDKDIQKHAEFFSSYSPYNLESLFLLEEIIEERAKSALFEILKKELDTNKELKNLPVSKLVKIKEDLIQQQIQLSQLLERAKQLDTSTNRIQNLKKEKEPISLFSFLEVFWKKIKNLFSKQEPKQQENSNLSCQTNSTTPLANKALVLRQLSCGP